MSNSNMSEHERNEDPSGRPPLSPGLMMALKESVAQLKPDYAGLTPEADLFISYIAKSIANNMVTQLEAASAESFVKTTDRVYMHHATVLSTLDKIIEYMRRRSPAASLGVKRTIIVDVKDFVESDNVLTEHFRRNNFSLVPVRLLQIGETPVTRLASTRFTEVLTQAVGSAYEQQLDSVTEPRVRQMFERQKMAYNCEQHMPITTPVCFFHLSEQSYQFPLDTSKFDANKEPYDPNFKTPLPNKAEVDNVFKHELAQFTINCTVCGGLHDLKVVR